LSMPVYIQSAVAISPQDTFLVQALHTRHFSRALHEEPGERGYFQALHPEYRDYINPAALRRMSPVIRMGLAASKVCMEQAGIDKPDAILVGTGLGCVRDTVKFLSQLIENREQLLNPTAFIQSTHNTVSGQIALMLGCRAHNLTFSQNNISFETALLEGMILLEEGAAKHILLGGIDELVDESFDLMQKAGCVNGRMGEGSNFFIISPERSGESLARIDGLEIINQCKDPGVLSGQIKSFLAKRNLTVEDIDLMISGRNTDEHDNPFFRQVEELFTKGVVIGYKHLVGQYYTSSAFATWLAARIIRDNAIPDSLRISGSESSKSEHQPVSGTFVEPIRRILLFNQDKGRDFTWSLISHPDIEGDK